MHNIDRTIDDGQIAPHMDPITDGAGTDPDAASPYGLIGLCLSLVAILLIALVYMAFAGGVAVLVDGLASGFAHPLDLVRRLVADAAAGDPATALHLGLGLSIAAYLAVSFAVLTLARFRGGTAWRHLIGWQPWSPLRTSRTYWLIAGGALIYSLAANFLVSFLYPPSQDWFTVPKETVPAVMLFVLAAVLAPVAEELLFRGWIYTSLRARFGVWTALFASAAVFAGAHYESSHIYALVVFPIGLALGAMRETTGSLKASISFHAFYNAIAYGLAAFDIG
jgi:uncharacterized protein